MGSRYVPVFVDQELKSAGIRNICTAQCRDSVASKD